MPLWVRIPRDEEGREEARCSFDTKTYLYLLLPLNPEFPLNSGVIR